MKKLFIQYKPFFIFLLKFFVLYVALTLFYKFYLIQYDSQKLEVDLITKVVATQSKNVLLWSGKEAEAVPNNKEVAMNLIYQGKFVARIIEGCNAISVMILFSAFVFAFSSNWLKTIGYILFGCVIIHLLNVLRIALLTIGLYNYPNLEHLLHGVVFPVFIYSTVFVLWVLWLQKFSSYAERNFKK